MSCLSCRSWVACVALVCPSFAWADRAPEDRTAATHVIVGVAGEAYHRDSKVNRHYLVPITITKVEKGDGLKVGDVIYAKCNRPRRDVNTTGLSEREKKELLFMVDGGHNLVPNEGQKVKVFLKKWGGTYEGIFPDWADDLDKK